jgi:CO dehydrogenase/acetyl-CoA synthase delta subunit
MRNQRLKISLVARRNHMMISDAQKWQKDEFALRQRNVVTAGKVISVGVNLLASAESWMCSDCLGPREYRSWMLVVLHHFVSLTTK